MLLVIVVRGSNLGQFHLVRIGAPPVALAAGALTLLSIFTHRANIERLIQGQEPKIGGGKTGS